MMRYLCIPLLMMLAISHANADQFPNNIRLVESARKQVGVTLFYDSAYVKLAYPNGDIALDRGVCTDVLIRALRDARQMDLQQLVHEDMASYFSVYPKQWGLSKTDKNIDHRRVPNLQTFLTRKAASLTRSHNPSDYNAGDIVTSMLPGNLPHIMIVSDKTTASGVRLVIHNIGRGAQEEDSLFAHPITGHYRLNK